jgi:hypothetical protein
MTTFLLIISFLLNIISLLAIVILYTRQNRFFDLEKKQGKMIQEMEETISTYILEMKEENDAFMNNLNKNKQEKKTQNQSEGKEKPQATKYKEMGSHANKRLNASKAYNKPVVVPDKSEGENDWESLFPFEEGITQEDTLVNRVITMHQDGLSIEEIAKRLGKGKTEIELLLKFNQKS